MRVSQLSVIRWVLRILDLCFAAFAALRDLKSSYLCRNLYGTTQFYTAFSMGI
ncbi:hypothetical protein BH11BAC1_BH11BAC1_15220 [soil metagenome]